MTSSWRWDSDEEFQEHVQPHALNEVPYVRHSYTIWSFAECARQLFEDIAALRRELKRLEELLEREAMPDLLDRAWEIAVDICHFGESILRYQKRLVLNHYAYGFLHGKEAIPHVAHKTHRPPTLRDLRQLAEDARELLAGFDKMEHAGTDFLVSSLDLPENLLRDFRLARDLFSVGFEEIGLLIAGRGLEGVLRRILAERHVRTDGSRTQAAAEADMNEMIEILKRLRWKADKTRFLPRGAAEILHWLRTTRNVGAHARVGDGEPFVSPRELALLVAQAANRVWKLHTSKPRQHLIVVSS